jgi:hypothetical protein
MTNKQGNQTHKQITASQRHLDFPPGKMGWERILYLNVMMSEQESYKNGSCDRILYDFLPPRK